jgi:hypothetical protein
MLLLLRAGRRTKAQNVFNTSDKIGDNNNNNNSRAKENSKHQTR